MSPELEFDEEEYKKNVLRINQAEADANDPVKQRLHLVSFISYSAGNGRKRRAREVTLLVVDNTYAHMVKNGEVKRRKNRDFIEADVLAKEVLWFLPPEDQTVDNLLRLATPKR